ncbi:MAG: pantoate--beta-alanine ligase [Verrucomicrobia bacterium]|nr:pantoate--beta-alanine ligase [Verrucomicrobiota bacterium]
MNLITSISGMREVVVDLKRRGRTISLVPTMGYLHEGHLSLIRLAKQYADFVVVSIFVNPLQFGPTEDLDAYPRDLERDRELCGSEGVDAVFYPSVKEMFPPGRTVFVEEEVISRRLEGECRPGHFMGVLTVVAKLLNIIQPDSAVFGKKDVQQLALIAKMVADLNIPVEIVAGDTVREPDGLAMSSRNRYLSEDEREEALCLRRSLLEAERLFAGGERDATVINEAMKAVIEQVPGARTDYAAVIDPSDWSPCENASCGDIVAAAIRIGKTRLIDNIVLGD